jgi:hypothetical protein
VIKPTCDRKTRFRKNQKNTFGLYPGPTGDGTCPFATIGEGGCAQIEQGRKLPTCYVFRTIAAYKNVGPALLHNTHLLKTATHEERVKLLKAEFSRFHRAESKQADPQMYYRLHWSGDVYDMEYAKALVEAMNAFPDIMFWNYTRSFELGHYLAHTTPNLKQYLSLDKLNIEDGLEVYNKYRRYALCYDNMYICYMAPINDFDEQYNKLRTSKHLDWLKNAPELVSCPTDEGKLPVDGACSKCRKCLNKNHIWFKTK